MADKVTGPHEHEMSIFGPFCHLCHEDWDILFPGWYEKYREANERAEAARLLQHTRELLENGVIQLSGYPGIDDAVIRESFLGK